jgi:hypothetical protein
MKMGKGLRKATEKAKRRIDQEQQRKETELAKYEPACLNSNQQNLEDGYYCWFCGKAWYNCVCCHCE